MKYTLPDVNTQWNSPNEIQAAMQERDSEGRRRYEHDPAFRAAVEAKCVLGTRLGGPVPIPPTGVMRWEHGRVEVLGPPVAYEAFDGEIQLLGERSRLQAELAALEVEAAKQATPIARALRIADHTDPTKPVSRFASKADMTAAMASAAYRNDPHARAHIEAAILASDFSDAAE